MTEVEGDETPRRPRQTTKFDRELKKLECSLSYKKEEAKQVETSKGEKSSGFLNEDKSDILECLRGGR